MEKKKCPYCGKEILEEAKKCKHCGVWIAQDKEAIVYKDNQLSDDEIADENIVLKNNIPFGELVVKITFWVAIFGVIISGIHSVLPDGDFLSTATGAGKTRLFKAFLNMCLIVPERVGQLLEGVAAALLLYSLMKGMLSLKNPFKSLFEYLIIFTLAYPSMLILSNFMEDFLGMMIVAILLMIAVLIVEFILGLKLSTVYQGELKKLGQTFIICSVIEACVIVLMTVGGDFFETEEAAFYFNLTCEIIDMVILWFYYSAIKDVQLFDEDDE